MKRIAVIYLADEKYHRYTLFSLVSFALHHQQPLDFHILQNGYSRPVGRDCEAFVRSRGHHLFVEGLEATAAAAAQARRAVTHGHVSHVACSKISALTRYAERYAHVLYIDGDILLFGDMGLYGRTGFAEACAACPDLSIATGFDDARFFDHCRQNSVSTRYFNSGLIFVNAEAWLARDMPKLFLEAHARHDVFCPYTGTSTCQDVDQCPSNMILNGAWHALPIAFNTQKSAYQTRYWDQAVGRHYTGARKFLPVRRHSCDPREYRLLRQINRILGDPVSMPSLYDWGLSYAANALRRRAPRRRILPMIDRMRLQTYAS